MNLTGNLGRIPIYEDSLHRTLVDPICEDYSPNEWHPMNGAADRLIKCVEGLQDIQVILESYSDVKNATKRRRRLRGVFVPLHSLCENITSLLNQIQSDKSMHQFLPKSAPVTISELRKKFAEMVPFSRTEKLGRLRNRISAHYEKSMSPGEMRDLFNSADTTEIGEWLHIAIGVLCDAIKLDAYMWTAEGPVPNSITNMCQEPLITIFRVEEFAPGKVRPVEILGCRFCSKSPRAMVFERIFETTETSMCLFQKPSKFQIQGFHEDNGIDWARSLTTSLSLSEKI